MTFLIGQSVPTLPPQLMILPPQPFHGDLRAIGVTTPPVQGFRGDGVGFHAMHAQVTVTSRCDGHLFERIEARTRFEILIEGRTTLFEELEVRLVVRLEFVPKMKMNVIGALLSLPVFKLLFALHRHPFGHVIVHIRPVVVVVVRMVWRIEEMRKVYLFQFRQPKGFRKVLQTRLENDISDSCSLRNWQK